MPIAYALAADHPDRLDRLVVGEGPLPGVAPSPAHWLAEEAPDQVPAALTAFPAPYRSR